jgi:hypothetical protein
MDKLASGSKARLTLACESGVPISAADEVRIAASVQGSLDALARAVSGSLFDTEPAHFDRLLKKKSEGRWP